MFVRSLISLVVMATAASFAIGQPPPPAKPDTPEALTWTYAGDGSYLGVQTAEVTKENAGKYGLREVRGVAVEKVVENSPAAAAGLRDGDVILKFNGEAVTSAGKLTRLIAEVSPDHQATVTVLRGGSEQDITVTIGKRPMPKFDSDNFTFAMPAMPDFDFHFDMPELKNLDKLKDFKFEFKDVPEFKQLEKMKDFTFTMPDLKGLDELKQLDKLKDWKNMPEFKELEKLKDMPQVWVSPQGGDDTVVWRAGEGRRIGVGVSDLTSQLAQKYGVSDGLMITEVNNDSPAAKAGLKAGDIITEINGKAVKSDIDLIREINSQKDGDVQLTIVRDGQRQTISVTPEKTKDSGYIIRSHSDGDGNGGAFMPNFAPLMPAAPAAPATAPRAPTAPTAHPAMSLFHRIV